MPGRHITNSRDIILLTPGSLPHNHTLQIPANDSRGLDEKIKNHAFLDTYFSFLFSALRSEIIESIYSEAEELRSNCGIPPEANFTYLSRSFSALNPDPMTFDLDASSSKDDDNPPKNQFITERPDFDIKEFKWTIDDTIKLGGIKVSHEFITEGPHVVELIVTDIAGNESEPLRMLVNVINEAPTPVVDLNNNGLSVTFDATKSSDDGKISEYRWKINGESFVSSSPIKTYQFPIPGKYLYELELIDNNGKSSPIVSKLIDVNGNGCSVTEYFSGLCPCSKPYRTLDEMWNFIYTCEPQKPLIDPYAVGYNRGIDPTISGTVTISECFKNPDDPAQNPLYTISTLFIGPPGLFIAGVCLDGSERLATGQPGGGGGLIDLSGRNEYSGTFTPLGDCYKWKYYGMDGLTIRWESDIYTLPGQYPYCR